MKLSVICAVINTYIHISLLSIKKRNQTNTVFDHSFKRQEDRQRYLAARRIFNSLLSILTCGKTRSFVLDILLKNYSISVVFWNASQNTNNEGPGIQHTGEEVYDNTFHFPKHDQQNILSPSVIR